MTGVEERHRVNEVKKVNEWRETKGVNVEGCFFCFRLFFMEMEIQCLKVQEKQVFYSLPEPTCMLVISLCVKYVFNTRFFYGLYCTVQIDIFLSFKMEIKSKILTGC